MNETNYWEELSSKMDGIKVDEGSVQKAINLGFQPQNVSREHNADCKCGHCDPVDACMLDKHPGDMNEDEHEVYVKSVYPQADTYDGLSAEELEKFKEYVAAVDPCLPPMDHPDLPNQEDLGKALSGYYNFVEAKHNEINKPVLEGIIVFYINVGQLPPSNAEAFVERMEDKVKAKLEERLPPTWMTLWIPTRERGTSVEVLRL